MHLLKKDLWYSEKLLELLFWICLCQILILVIHLFVLMCFCQKYCEIVHNPNSYLKSTNPGQLVVNGCVGIHLSYNLHVNSTALSGNNTAVLNAELILHRLQSFWGL